MNAVHLTGRLTRDPEVRVLDDGTTVVGVRLAVDGMARGNAVGFIDVVSFGKSAEAAGRILAKGWLVGVSGRLQWRQYEPDDGGPKRTVYEVVGNLDFLAAPKPAAPSAVDAAAEPVAA